MKNDYLNDLYNQERIAEIMKCINDLDEKVSELITNILIKEKNMN